MIADEKRRAVAVMSKQQASTVVLPDGSKKVTDSKGKVVIIPPSSRISNLTGRVITTKTTPFGGFATKEAQQKALVSAIQESQQKFPEKFKTGFVSQPAEKQIQDVQQAVEQITRRTNFPESSFEALYPIQTGQLIKIGKDLTFFGQKVTEIDGRLAGIEGKNRFYDEKIPYFDQKIIDFDKKFIDHDDKLVKLGSSVSDASKGAGLGSLLGGIGTTGLLVIGGVLLLLVLRK